VNLQLAHFSYGRLLRPRPCTPFFLKKNGIRIHCPVPANRKNALRTLIATLFAASAALNVVPAPAQIALGAAAAPVPAAAPAATTTAPKAPPHTFHDPNYKIAFDYPADWNFTRRDGEVSTFRLDARNATPATTLRAVASIPSNPFPTSTFSGAFFYLSVTPHSTDAACTSQAASLTASQSGDRPVKSSAATVGGLTFTHGHTEQRAICTVEHDDVYTVLHRGSCYRFDLTINNFCGGEVSGVRAVTDEQLDDIRSRMESILSTVRFDAK
jgi:hypothetical protein